MTAIKPNEKLDKMVSRGIDPQTIEMMEYSGVDLEGWLRGFDDVTESVAHSVNMVRHHPLLDKNVPVHGLVIDPTTGKLDVVVDGNENR